MRYTAIAAVVVFLVAGTMPAAADGSPPVVTAPLPYISHPQPVANPSTGVYTIKLSLRWTVSDPDGIQSQDLQVSIDSAAYAPVVPAPPPDARSVIVTQTIGHLYRYRLTATDTLGATSAPVFSRWWHTDGLQESDATLSDYPGWTVWHRIAHWGGAEAETNAYVTGTQDPPQSTATFHFYGSRFAVVGSTSRYGAYADIYVDGQLRGTVDFYSWDLHRRQIVFVLNAIPWSGPGGQMHTVKIASLAPSHNPQSQGNWVYVDGLVVLR